MGELDSDILAAAWDNKNLLWELWKNTKPCESH